MVRCKFMIILLLFTVTCAVYWRAGSSGFVNYDDPGYVTENLHVKDGPTLDNVRWAFTSVEMANWHPLTWLSHMADCGIYGLNPWGHHLTSVLIHAANGTLLFLLFAGMTGAVWQSAFVAALFALHPLHVESVIWVAERKDVLSTLFFLLTLLAYSRYVKRPAPLPYLAALAAFALGLMAKPMLVTLPIVLLLLDYWPLERMRPAGAGTPLSRLLVEKIPFFLLTVISCVVTIYTQKSGGAVLPIETTSIAYRLANGVTAYAGYLWKTVWPGKMIIIYLLPRHIPPWKVFGAALLIAGISFAVYRLRRRAPYLPVGWFWFLGTLVPVIGLLQVGVQAMADRYTYIPLIGIFLMITWGIPELLQKVPRRRLLMATAASLVIPLLAAGTWAQSGYWRDSETLFRHVLEVAPDNYIAAANLGQTLFAQGRVDEALEQYRNAVRIFPFYAKAHYDLGVVLAEKGRTDEAIAEYNETLRIEPDNADAHYGLGVTYGPKGMLDKAVVHLEAAVRLAPGNPAFRTDLARAYHFLGDDVRAEQELRTAANLKEGRTAE